MSLFPLPQDVFSCFTEPSFIRNPCESFALSPCLCRKFPWWFWRSRFVAASPWRVCEGTRLLDALPMHFSPSFTSECRKQHRILEKTVSTFCRWRIKDVRLLSGRRLTCCFVLRLSRTGCPYKIISRNVRRTRWLFWSTRVFPGHVPVEHAILLPVFYGCETWLHTLKEERRLKVFKNRVLRRIFGPKGDEVTGEWRKLRNEGFYGVFSFPNIIRVMKSKRMRWAGHVARMGEIRGVYMRFGGETWRKEPLGRPRHRWEDNIKMDLQEVGWGARIGLIWLWIGTGVGLL